MLAQALQDYRLVAVEEEGGRQGHVERTLQDGDEEGDNAGAGDEVEVVGVEGRVGDDVVGGNVATLEEAEEDDGEGLAMDGVGEQVEGVGGSDEELGMVLVEVVVQVVGDNAEDGGGMGLAEVDRMDLEVQHVDDKVGVMGNWVDCKLAGKGGLVARGGVGQGLVMGLLWAWEVKERVMQRKVQEAEKRELVRMGVERVVVACVGLEEGEGHCV